MQYPASVHFANVPFVQDSVRWTSWRITGVPLANVYQLSADG